MEIRDPAMIKTKQHRITDKDRSVAWDPRRSPNKLRHAESIDTLPWMFNLQIYPHSDVLGS